MSAQHSKVQHAPPSRSATVEVSMPLRAACGEIAADHANAERAAPRAHNLQRRNVRCTETDPAQSFDPPN